MSKLADSKLEDCTNGVITIDEYKKFLSSQGKVSRELNLQIATIGKHLNAMDKLKPGTVANIGQITTISKKRIVNPIRNTNSLYNVRLSASDLDEINEKLKKLYTFEKNNS